MFCFVFISKLAVSRMLLACVIYLFLLSFWPDLTRSVAKKVNGKYIGIVLLYFIIELTTSKVYPKKIRGTSVNGRIKKLEEHLLTGQLVLFPLWTNQTLDRLLSWPCIFLHLSPPFHVAPHPYLLFSCTTTGSWTFGCYVYLLK